MKKREVIIACDFASAAQTLAFLDRFEEDKPYVKIGMELFYAAGPAMVETLRDRGYKIFLDLKLHDIPNTVKKAMAVLAGLGVDMTNLHAAGGIDMMRAAIEGLTVDGVRRTKCIAVTQLTSTSEARLHDELWISHSMEDTVLHYAENARTAGLDGVVCSPWEAGAIHERLGADFATVTPGVRFADGDAGDQVRIATPAKAWQLGSDYIVVGRPITKADNPAAAYRRCVAEFSAAEISENK